MAEKVETQKTAPNSKLSRRRLTLVVVLACLIAVGLLAFWHFHSANKSKGPYGYTYKLLQAGSVSGGKTGTTMDFSRPVEFISRANLAASDFQTFDHKVQNKIIGTLFAADSPLLNPQLGAAVFKSISDPLNAGPINKNYQSVVQPISNFVQQAVAPYIVNLSAAQVLTTPNIKQNAWEFKISGVDTNNKQIPGLQGLVVYAIGKNAIYYYGIMVTPDNWSHNSKIWPQLINAIKVDQ